MRDLGTVNLSDLIPDFPLALGCSSHAVFVSIPQTQQAYLLLVPWLGPSAWWWSHHSALSLTLP